MIKKTEGEESLNIWQTDDLNKIIPPFLFNMHLNGSEGVEQGAESGEETLGGLAENGIKALVSSAGLAHIDAVFIPVLQ